MSTGHNIPKSIPTGAQYVTLHIKIKRRKMKIYRFNSGKWFCSCICAPFAEAGKRRSKVVHLLEKSVINMIRQLLPVFDWPNIVIGPGGFLLVVPIYLQSQFQFYWWGCKKKWITELGCEKYFAGSHTKHWWACSKSTILLHRPNSQAYHQKFAFHYTPFYHTYRSGR